MPRARVTAARAGGGTSVVEADLPMRAVVRLTGLTADTVRAWERRHAAITPARTEGNARRYSAAQVRRLSLLRAAVMQGHGIGELAGLSDEILARLGRTDAEAAGVDPLAAARREVLDAVLRFDAHAAEATLGRAAVSLSARALGLELLVPLLREVGERWHDGALSIAQEHLATQLVRALIESLVRAHSAAAGAPRIVLAAPAGELHDAGLLVAALLACDRGIDPVLLGANLPMGELRVALRRTRAAVAVISCVRDLSPLERATLPAEIAALAEEHELWLGVPEGHALALMPSRARVFTSLEAFDAALVARFGT